MPEAKEQIARYIKNMEESAERLTALREERRRKRESEKAPEPSPAKDSERAEFMAHISNLVDQLVALDRRRGELALQLERIGEEGADAENWDMSTARQVISEIDAVIAQTKKLEAEKAEKEAELAKMEQR